MRSSKMYMHEIQHFGGKTAVLFDEITRWLGSLWHGKSLALTIAWISVISATGLFLLARVQDDDPA